MKRKKNTYYFCVLFFLLSMVMYSNGKNPPYPKPNGPGPYPELPIDGGVSFLLFAGAIYGVYKLRKK
jgi:hypothetical protein